MADTPIVSTEVKPIGSPATDERLVGTGLTIVPGEVLYVDPTTDTWLKATASGTVEQAQATHIALNGGSDGQLVTAALMQRGLVLDLGAGAALAPGSLLVLSANAGRHAPAADLVSTNFSTYLCSGFGSNQAIYNVNPSGQQIP